MICLFSVTTQRRGIIVHPAGRQPNNTASSVNIKAFGPPFYKQVLNLLPISFVAVSFLYNYACIAFNAEELLVTEICITGRVEIGNPLTTAAV